MAGRRLRSSKAPDGGRRGDISKKEEGGGGGESWTEYAKRKKLVRICSTAPYEADKLYPVETHTSVTSVTISTTQSTQSTATTTSSTATTGSLKEMGWPALFCFAVFRANTMEQD